MFQNGNSLAHSEPTFSLPTQNRHPQAGIASTSPSNSGFPEIIESRGWTVRETASADDTMTAEPRGECTTYLSATALATPTVDGTTSCSRSTRKSLPRPVVPKLRRVPRRVSYREYNSACSTLRGATVKDLSWIEPHRNAVHVHALPAAHRHITEHSFHL